MGLFTPAWNNKDPEKRMKAIKKIADFDRLRKIAERVEYDDVRQEAWKQTAMIYSNKPAVEKITN